MVVQVGDVQNTTTGGPGRVAINANHTIHTCYWTHPLHTYGCTGVIIRILVSGSESSLGFCNLLVPAL